MRPNLFLMLIEKRKPVLGAFWSQFPLRLQSPSVCQEAYGGHGQATNNYFSALRVKTFFFLALLPG